jgi:cell pole-organizing protein PopZ
MADTQHASPEGRGPAVDPRGPAASHAAGGDPAASEASVDDILASIRRILSEEDPAPVAPVLTGPHTYERREVPPPATRDQQDDVLDLHPGMLVPPDRRPEASLGAGHPPAASPAAPPHADENEDEHMSEPDFDTYAAQNTPPHVAHRSEPAAEQVAELARHIETQGPRPAEPRPSEPHGLIAPAAAAAAAQSVGDLVRTLAAERHTAVSRSGPSIEDLVREEIRPVLREWLDTHLPPLVERLVRIEIERVIARGSV